MGTEESDPVAEAAFQEDGICSLLVEMHFALATPRLVNADALAIAR
jgi:hypothetical protein